LADVFQPVDFPCVELYSKPLFDRDDQQDVVQRVPVLHVLGGQRGGQHQIIEVQVSRKTFVAMSHISALFISVPLGVVVV